MTRMNSYFDLADAFRSGDRSPGRELEDRLVRLDGREPGLKAFACIDREGARASASESDARWKAGRPLSPVDGMIVGIKDIIETVNMATGQGSPLWNGSETHRDAASVQALREAGAVILGKTTTTEFAAAHTFAPTVNPHDASRTPGGSSSGSAAAVGAGILHAGLGTQVVGSILRPSSFCGAVGFKPTFGALNRGGSYDYLSQSSTGIIAATPEDAWIVASAIARRVGGDPGYPPLDGPELPPTPAKPQRLAILQSAGWGKATEGAKRAFAEACLRLETVGIELADRTADPEIEVLEQAVTEAQPLTLAINAWESAWPLGTYAARDGSALSRSALDRLAQARKMTAADYRALLARRNESRQRHAAAGARYAALVMLGATGAAPRGLDFTGDPVINVPASWLGAPAITLPLLADEGLPLGLQLVGLPGRDADTLAAARWIGQHYGPA